jgi:Fe-S oxidoreductase
MTVDQAAFQEFRDSLANIAADAPADDLSDDERLARVRKTFIAKLDRRTAIDLETCIHCGMCAEACHYYVSTGEERYAPTYKFEPLRRFYRRQVSPLRWANRLFTKRTSIEELREWQELVYEACTGCGRCDMICPMGINISTAIGVMREGLASAGLVPDELRALQAEQEEKHSIFGVDADQLRKLAASFREQGVELPLDRDTAEVMVLTTAVEVRLFPESLRAVAKIMAKSGADWTIFSGSFEAANIGLISGDKAVRRNAMRRIVEQAQACGAKIVVVPESGHAYQALRWEAPNELGAPLPFDVLAISEYVAEAVNDGRLNLKTADENRMLTYHDPCRLGRQGGVYEAPRELLAEMGHHVRDTEANRRESLCCGGGCGEYTISHSAPLRQRAFELKRHELDDTGTEAVVTGCANCRINFLLGAANSGWETPVMSLVETVAENIAD